MKEESLNFHKLHKGKLEVNSKVSLNTKEDLILAYTPGVSYPCLEINKDENKVYDYTIKGNSICIVTDGSAVLGLGNIGVKASLPVMEGKAILFKKFANIDAYPITIDSCDVDEIVRTVKLISAGFGGINLEDISAPRCFEIEEKLKEVLDIPVFHDDQHGTAIAVCAALINSLKITNKKIEDITIVINGAGSAGIAICKLLQSFNPFNIILVDKMGSINRTTNQLNDVHRLMAKTTNKFNVVGTLENVLKGASVFIGVSAGNILTKEMIDSMEDDPIIFAMANPTPEISYDEVKLSKAKIYATGRSDYPNQINNCLVFPGIFKGVLSVKAKQITENMKKASAIALASLVSEEELSKGIIIPSVFNPKVCEVVAESVINEYNKKD